MDTREKLEVGGHFLTALVEGKDDLVKLHYFAGLTLEQVAIIQGISRRTALKHLSYARAWLHRKVPEGGDQM
jgi:DNA-directed RNA polymerase specialized sigma24 family protein